MRRDDQAARVRSSVGEASAVAGSCAEAHRWAPLSPEIDSIRCTGRLRAAASGGAFRRVTGGSADSTDRSARSAVAPVPGSTGEGRSARSCGGSSGGRRERIAMPRRFRRRQWHRNLPISSPGSRRQNKPTIHASSTIQRDRAGRDRRRRPRPLFGGQRDNVPGRCRGPGRDPPDFASGRLTGPPLGEARRRPAAGRDGVDHRTVR